jgi:T-complex protein 1 subunit gamma
MAVSVGLQTKARSVVGVEGWPYRAVADAMEVIPRTLAQNSGGNVIRVLTELRVSFFFLLPFLNFPFYPSLQAKHANGENSWGINGETGKIVDMKTYGLYESASVKVSISFLFR